MNLHRAAIAEVRSRLTEAPIVTILGARQIGKTTLSQQIAAQYDGRVHHFDLEDPADEARLAEPGVALRPLEGLVVLDEIQRAPELYPLLRVLADRRPNPARFLLLGSVSPELVRGVSESLAGRVAFVDLEGFGLDEVGADALDALWLRGGFPLSFLAADDASSYRWRQDFVRTFLLCDLAQVAPGVAAMALRRFWNMLAHLHGQVLNASRLGRAMSVTDNTARKYVDLLAGTFVVRVLPPWFENVGKRQVKHPKVYLSDSGLLHALLGLQTRTDLERHPIVGHSWEGFAMQEVVRRLGARPSECHFWATHAGAELDLLIVRGGRRFGFEMKRTDAPRRTRSMHAACTTLNLDRLDVVHAGAATWPMGDNIRALALGRVLEDLQPL